MSILNSYRPLKILVVDDDRSNRLMLKVFLNRLAHAVVESENGQQAIAVFEREKPDLILMDVTMPVMNGYEAAVAIKQLSGTQFVPIIFLTGLTDDESLAHCVESGGDDFLSKPFNSILIGAKILAMQRILKMHQELETYRKRTEEEIELTQHVFDSVIDRGASKELAGLAKWVLPAGHFSGDLMLYDQSPSGKIYLMLADFTGHGFSAAIGALPTADIFFALTPREFSPIEILTEMNRKLREVMPRGHFCAITFALIDPFTKQIDIFNAGLPPALIFDETGKVKALFSSDHIALGFLKAVDFKVEMTRYHYSANDIFVLYSDGVTEAQNGSGEMFGEVRLMEALTNSDNPLAAVKVSLNHFIGSHPPDDDISLITFRL